MDLDAIVLLGREHPTREHDRLVVRASFAAALSPGTPTSPKRDPNEDAVAVTASDALVLAAVADAHYGAEAAEIAVTTAAEHFQRWCAEPPAPPRWPMLLQGLYETAWERLPEGTRSEAALVVLVLERARRNLMLAEVGDCGVFCLGGPRGVEWSEREHRWLGRSARAADSFHVTSHALPAEARYILATTDGLLEPIYGVSVLAAQELNACATGPLPEVAERLMHEALRADRRYLGDLRGGEDNVAFALLPV